jgi:O-antigen/teichoic acid export membrane protein
VKIIFGNNWIDVTPILQILALGLYFRIGYKINSEIVKAKGMVFNNAFIQLIYAILVIAGCYVGQFYGINGISFGILSALIINFINMTYIGIKASKIKPSRIFNAHFNGILISFTIYFVLSLIDNFTFYINSSILFKALSSFIIYLLINLVFVELTGRDKVIKLLLNIVGKKNVKKK